MILIVTTSSSLALKVILNSQGILSGTGNKFLTKKFLYQFVMVPTIIPQKIEIQFL